MISIKQDYYLFPFSEVRENSKIVIFGAGEIGKQYVQQLACYPYCDCIFFVDNYYDKNNNFEGKRVCNPEYLNNQIYDYIVIAADKHNEEISNQLKTLKVSPQKIIKQLNKLCAEKKLMPTPNPENTKMWDRYYESAELFARIQYKEQIQPIVTSLNDITYSHVLDFACGKGRIANIFSDFVENLTCCDINENAIEYCKERFSNSSKCKFKFHINDNLNKLPFYDEEFTFIYSWDAMVHFNYKLIDQYTSEFYRIIRKGGYILIHHSNYGNISSLESKNENWQENPHWRALISKEDVRFIAEKYGFTVIEQKVIDWDLQGLDCITLMKK